MLPKTAINHSGSRHPRDTKLIRKADGVEFFVLEDKGGPIRLKEFPDKLFDRSFFRLPK